MQSLLVRLVRKNFANAWMAARMILKCAGLIPRACETFQSGMESMFSIHAKIVGTSNLEQ